MAQIRCVCQPSSGSETYCGKLADEVITDFARHTDFYQSNPFFPNHQIIFSWCFICSDFFPILSFDWPYLPFSPFSSLFNNNLLSSFILQVMISSSVIALCSFPIRDISDGFLCSSVFPFLPPFCILSAALLVSVSAGPGSSLWVCMAGFSLSLHVWH